jgi:hypothetical protein
MLFLARLESKAFQHLNFGYFLLIIILKKRSKEQNDLKLCTNVADVDRNQAEHLSRKIFSSSVM